MMRAVLLVCAFFLSFVHGQYIPTFWFTQKLDHFNAQDNRTFQQRFYLYDGYWDGTGPILMYVGAETQTGPDSLNFTTISVFGPALGALLVSAEHRYYGGSLPFGASPSVEELAYLTVEQALADYVEILNFVREKYNATNVPAFSAGGSYGGLLSSAIRIRYPSDFYGAWATGPPFNLENLPPSMYFNSTSYAYVFQDKMAAAILQEGFQQLLPMIQTQSGRDQLQSMFKLCNPLESVDDGYAFLFWAQWGFVGPAEFNYWYPMGLYGVPYPLEHVCKLMTSANSSLEAVVAAVTFSWNFTGVHTDPACFPTIIIYDNAGPTGVGLYEFEYQMCTQFYLPSGSNGETDLFYQTNDTLIEQNFITWCQEKFGAGIVPDLDYWKDNYYGDGKFRGISNIVFTQGIYDPVRGFGLVESLSDSVVQLVAVMAHTQDLLPTYPGEDPSVELLRQQVLGYLQNWTAEYNAMKIKN